MVGQLIVGALIMLGVWVMVIVVVGDLKRYRK
jgi:hypothetical protein